MRSRTIREGSLGLFILLGLAISGALVLWLRTGSFGRDNYTIVGEFPDAGGVQVGGAVRYRGVQVGRITDIKAGSNGINVIMEINSAELRIPANMKLEANRSGLLGESSIDITPLEELSSAALSLSPRGSECDPKVILCNNSVLKGQVGLDPIRTLARLSEIYSDPKFYDNFTRAVDNIANASGEITVLTKQLSGVAKAAEDDLRIFSETAQTITKAVNQTTAQITKTTEQLNLTASGINTLATNLNQLVVENRSNVTKTLTTINGTSDDLRKLVNSMQVTIGKVNESLTAADTKKLVRNLEVLSTNLRSISDTFNQPGNLNNLQQILDSARTTFANTQKITSDLDELTGDPALRENIRRLVNGLGKLVSLRQDLEQQVQTAQTLQLLTQQLQVQSTSNQVGVNR